MVGSGSGQYNWHPARVKPEMNIDPYYMPVLAVREINISSLYARQSIKCHLRSEKLKRGDFKCFKSYKRVECL